MKRINNKQTKIEWRFDNEVDAWIKVHNKKLKNIISWEVYLRKKLTNNFLKDKYHNKKINILEIGCGAGENVSYLSKNEPKWKIKGVDISSNMIAFCKTKKVNKNISFEVLNINKNNLNQKFDVIIMLGVVGYLNNNKAFSNINNMLKEGGTLIFTYGNKKSLLRSIRNLLQNIKRSIFNSNKSYFKNYNHKEIKKLIKNYKIIKKYNLCYGVGLGKWEINLSRFIENKMNYESFLNLNLTNLVILKK